MNYQKTLLLTCSMQDLCFTQVDPATQVYIAKAWHTPSVYFRIYKFTRTISYLHWHVYEYYKYGNTSNMCVQKLWYGTIRWFGTINIIYRNKDKALQIVLQYVTIQGCSTNRVNAVLISSLTCLRCQDEFLHATTIGVGISRWYKYKKKFVSLQAIGII